MNNSDADTILTLAGSPSQRSRSSALLSHVAGQLRGHGFNVQEMGLHDIPASDLIGGEYGGSAAAHLRSRIRASSAVIISTPVYKASFSGGLKAVLDLLDERSLAGKVVLPLATGGSLAHLLALEYSLKPVLSALGARHILSGVYAIEKQVTFNDDGYASFDAITADRLRESIDRLVEVMRPTAVRFPAYDLGKLVAAAKCST